MREANAEVLNRSPDIVLPALKTIQKAEKLVSRLVAPWPAVWWGCLGKGLFLHRKCCVDIDLRRLEPIHVRAIEQSPSDQRRLAEAPWPWCASTGER